MSDWNDSKLIEATQRMLFGDGLEDSNVVDADETVKLSPGRWEIWADNGRILLQLGSKSIQTNDNDNPIGDGIPLYEGRTFYLRVDRDESLRIEPDANAVCTLIRRADLKP